MKSMILGDMGGYIANRTWERDEYRLDTLETELEVIKVTQKAAGFPILAGLGDWIQRFSRNLFNSKAVEEGKIRL